MQRTTAIISLFLLLNSSTELHEIFRLPILLEHYRQHNTKEATLSLIEFLKIHYTGQHPDDKDDSKDRNLPFKSVDNICHTDSPVFTKKQLPARPVICIRSKLSTYQFNDIPDKRVASIFHPPRVIV